jgi:hypothetical protein
MTHHTGGCHCGATRFDVEIDIEKPVMCNCSRCRKLGWAMGFVPLTSFKLTAEGPLTEYLFNKEHIRHQFCTTCGIEAFAYATAPDGTPTVAVNLNSLDGIDAHALALKAHVFDGASL